MTRWFTSDLHLSHARILEFEPRGHADVNAMNQAIINRFNAHFGQDDELWIVGDIALGPIDESLPLLANIAASLVLVAGNHDRCHPSNKKHDLWLSAYQDLPNVTAVHLTSAELTLPDGTEATVCHFPYPPDARPRVEKDGTVTPDKFQAYRPVDAGGWLIHGHVHSAWRQNGRQINVGVDAWGGELVSEQTLTSMVHTGPAQLPAVPWPARPVRLQATGHRPGGRTPAGR